jgi:membrane-associated protease RseP (regulator of RpoE activity)
MDDFERRAAAITALVADLFEIDAHYRQGENLVLSLSFRYRREKSLKLLKDRLKTAGYSFTLNETEEPLLLTINPKPRFRIPRLNVILFAATLFTVYVVPVFVRSLAVAPTFRAALDDTVAALGRGDGLQFTVAMISILFVHEMGHFLAGRRRSIVTSLPYFIPAPNIIGTFGAIIKSKSPFWNRRDLIEVGAAGPIAGWVVAVAWLLYGLSQSTVQHVFLFPPGALFFSLDGESILMRLATLGILGPAPPMHFYYLSEAAFAGWVGLLVTAINLLPIGQLDGGHILYGLFRRHQHKLGLVATLALIALGFQSFMWWVFAAFGLIFGMYHPPTLDDARPPGTAAAVMGVVALLILVVSFTPVPFR